MKQDLWFPYLRNTGFRDGNTFFVGGAIYNNLDYTFQTGYEDGSGGTGFSGEWYSGCVNPIMKNQMGMLLRFMNTLDFINMRPDRTILAGTFGDEQVFPLANEGIQYAFYFIEGSRPKAVIHFPAGNYRLVWMNPADLIVVRSEVVIVEDKPQLVIGPEYKDDIVLKVDRI